ncbi:phosphoinositide 3-kinase adapter protein 1 isoform X2 [Anoplophora glabripennis]|nr:phosphoinositide 3-kinase adapter protein 1 isoform X2 [Anoplophora glabripennis]
MGNGESASSASECSLTRQLTPPRAKNVCRDKKSYLRSVSSNSADSNQELLIMGEPRLSDIAPDLAFKHPASRSNSLKSNRADIVGDLSYIPLATSEEQADSLSGDEVFITEESARYYNLPAAKRNGHRRHSIGTFVARDRTYSTASSSRSFKEDFPPQEKEGAAKNIDIDDHSLRHASYPRKRCTRCTRGASSKMANMDDILIVSLKCSDAAALWVEYFSNYFQEISKQANRKPFKIQYLDLEEAIKKSPEEYKEVADKTSGVKLQLVVVCPSFLEFISENPEESCNVGKLLLADRTLALLLGVADTDLNDVHKKVLPTYFQWQRQCVGQDQDENFTKEFLGQAMTILSRVWKQQSSVIAQEKSCFSVTPKKIRQGQNSVFILLTYPLQKEDIVKISVEKNGELYEIKSVKRRNPYIMKITVPETLTEVTAIVNVLVEKNGSIIGSRPIKCESRLRELEQILRSANNPVEFMCQTLGFSPANRDHLDNWLVHGFQRNLPPHFNLLANHHTPFAAAVQAHKHSHEEFPTVLHFSTKFGLEKLTMQLLDCPGADVAYEIRNIYDMTPLEIAEANGFTELATMLRGYINMNEFTSMYAKLKEMSLTPKSDVDDEGYLMPKNVQDFYKLCPAPRPVIPESNHIETPSSECASPLGGYMAMNTPVYIPKEEPKESSKKSTIDDQEPIPPTENLEPVPKNHKHKKKIDVIEDKVQKELVEIINDFKNNVHSISQVEKLVEEWKNRNDVQKSFKEKQEQLMEMRVRYEQIQTELKTAMKKPTPFERIKKMFWKNRHDKQEVATPILNAGMPSITIVQSQRPISSLSTSSSGSSGRMSTISGCSLGDSGTHSDNEDRKMMLGSHCEDDFRSDLNKAVLELNYTPVPAPKPVKMFPTRHTFETIEEKPVTRPDNLPLNEEYYIQFPPSGLPVQGTEKSEQDQMSTSEYMNVTASTSTHEYMNFKVPLSR